MQKDPTWSKCSISGEGGRFLLNLFRMVIALILDGLCLERWILYIAMRHQSQSGIDFMLLSGLSLTMSKHHLKVSCSQTRNYIHGSLPLWVMRLGTVLLLCPFLMLPLEVSWKFLLTLLNFDNFLFKVSVNSYVFCYKVKENINTGVFSNRFSFSISCYL